MHTDTPEYVTDNIIVGSAELQAKCTGASLCWAIPGGGVVHDRTAALKIAARMNRIIQANLQKYSRKLFC